MWVNLLYLCKKSPIFSVFLVVIVLLSSCNSSLSDGTVADLSVICAKIEIHQNLSDRKDNRVTVSLYDDNNNKIDNKNISIRVNGFLLDTVKTTRLYYITSNVYTRENVPVGDMYRFEIMLTNQKTYVLGNVKPIAESDENTISLPEHGDYDQDFVLSWHNLKEISELSISKGVVLKTSTKTETNYAYETTVLGKIDAEGSYRIPKSSYVNSKSTLSGIEMKFTALKFGTMNKQLLSNSEIKISGHLDKYVDFDEDKLIAR